jgi:oligopeptide transport system substrate-binding protein
MKKFFSIACSAAMALSLVACSSSSSTSSDDSASSTSTGDNYVVLAKENDVISMSSAYATDGMSFEMIAATVEGLESMDADGNVIPAIAESYEISEDGLTYTFTLRDAQWDNGDPVTANDFVFAWNETVHSPKAEYAYLFGSDGACIGNADEIIEDQETDVQLDISAPDEKTLVVNLSKKCPYFLSLMSFPVFFPINEEFYEEQGDDYALTPDNLLANGPYKLVSWVKGNSLQLDKNETYWDADNVNVDGIKVNIVAEASTSALDFQSGNTDFTKLNSTLVDKYIDTDEYTSYLEGYLWYLQYNLSNEYLANENVRKALATVIDREDLADNVLKDGSIAIGGFVPAEFSTGPDGKDYVETAESYYDLTGDDALAAAQEYWDKAKEELGVDSITLNLLYESADPAKPAAEFIQSELQQLDGLTINMVSKEKNARIEDQKAGDFDIVLTRWGPDYADPTTYLNLMITGNAYNYGGYSNEEYDAKMQEAADAETDEERWELLHEAEAILMDDSPVVGVFQVGGASLVSTNVTGIENHTFGTPYIYKNLKKTN